MEPDGALKWIKVVWSVWGFPPVPMPSAWFLEGLQGVSVQRLATAQPSHAKLGQIWAGVKLCWLP